MRPCFICESESRCSHREEGLWKFYAEDPEAGEIQRVVADAISTVLQQRKPAAVQERAIPFHQAATRGARLTLTPLDIFGSHGVPAEESVNGRPSKHLPGYRGVTKT